jgi:alcohol dehydrogenase
VLFLADILPTAFEVGVLNGAVSPGDVVAIVGAGPVGLSAILTAKLYTPGRIVAIDLADTRLASALRLRCGHHDQQRPRGRARARDGAHRRSRCRRGARGGRVPQTFELATELIRPGGRVANIGVHGKPATLHLEKLWTRDVTITTGLVDTFSIPQLLRLIADGRLDPSLFATHHYPLEETMTAYDTFADAANTGALKVVLRRSERPDPDKQHAAALAAH